MEELSFAGKFLKIYGKGDIIFIEGSVGSCMYVISSGKVQIVSGADGATEVQAVLGKGNIFGEMALVDHLPRSASAIAFEDYTQVLEIDHALFIYLVGQQPAFGLMIQKALSRRLRKLQGFETEAIQVCAETVVAQPPTGGKSTVITKLKDNVYSLRCQCSSYLVQGTRKNLLIDTCLPWETGKLESQLNSIGLTKEDIHLVVLTHEHLDHIGGVPHFLPSTVVAGHVLSANKISMQDEFVMMSKSFHINVADYHVDLHLHHGTCLDLGGTVIQVLHTPGHSSGSICLYEPDQQLLFSGDTIFAGGVLGGIFPSGSLSDYTLTLRQLSALRIKEIYPGHGKISLTPEEDFAKAVTGSINLVNDTRTLFSALDTMDEFAQMAKAVSTYAKRV